jgi:4a-hydroxytetrahydrobiopterin dehydratase
MNSMGHRRSRVTMEAQDLIPLSEAEIHRRLEALPGWSFGSDRLSKQYEFDSFTDGIQFVNGLVLFCNRLDHHPDMTIAYKKIRFDLSRFSVGGKVTERDFTVARKIEDDFTAYAERQVH